MKNCLRTLAVASFVGLTVVGCADELYDPSEPAISSTMLPNIRRDLGTLTYRAVDLMLASSPQVKPDTPLLVASISDVQNVESSSPFGNLIADLIRTRLVQDGHPNAEMRLRASLSFNKGTGEFMLSRDPRRLLHAPAAAAVVTGTYAASAEKIYVSIKVVSVTDAHIIAGADYVVSAAEVAGLLPRQST